MQPRVLRRRCGPCALTRRRLGGAASGPAPRRPDDERLGERGAADPARRPDGGRGERRPPPRRVPRPARRSRTDSRSPATQNTRNKMQKENAPAVLSDAAASYVAWYQVRGHEARLPLPNQTVRVEYATGGESTDYMMPYHQRFRCHGHVVAWASERREFLRHGDIDGWVDRWAHLARDE